MIPVRAWRDAVAAGFPRTRGDDPARAETYMPWRPMFFAGIWREWPGVRGPNSKPAAGPHRIFSFLTCEQNRVLAPLNPRAMPVVLSTAEAHA